MCNWRHQRSISLNVKEDSDNWVVCWWYYPSVSSLSPCYWLLWGLSLSEGCNTSLHLSRDRGNTSLFSLSRADLLSIVKGPGYPLLAEFAASYNITLILDWNITHIEYQLLLHNLSFICSCLFIHYDGSICHIDAINQIIPHPTHPHHAGHIVPIVDLLFVVTIAKQTVTGDPRLPWTIDYWPNKLLSYDTNIPLPPDISTLTDPDQCHEQLLLFDWSLSTIPGSYWLSMSGVAGWQWLCILLHPGAPAPSSG